MYQARLNRPVRFCFTFLSFTRRLPVSSIVSERLFKPAPLRSLTKSEAQAKPSEHVICFPPGSIHMNWTIP